MSRAGALARAAGAIVLGVGIPRLGLAAAPPVNDSTYKLVFADEFNGPSLDPFKWNYNYPWGTGHTHNHAAYMDASQVKFTGSSLNLQAIAVRNPNAVDFYDSSFGWQVMDYTSGAINSSGKFNTTYGYFEASIKQPSELGTWPAFWMLQNGWPPEIDIMEYVRNGDTQGAKDSKFRTWANYHYTNASNVHASYSTNAFTSSDLSAAYHAYGVEWTATKMTFYLDGNSILTVNDSNAIADAAGMYMILNHGVGGWAGAPPDKSVFPADYLIDYVRVYQKNANASATTTWGATAASGSWDTAGNWSQGTPKYQDLTAVFGANSNSAVTTTWSNSRTAGGLLFNGTSTAFTVGNSAGSLQLAATGGTSLITVASSVTASQTVNSRLELYSSTLVSNNATGAATLTLAGEVAGDGGLTFKGTGTTILSGTNTYRGDTYIDSGTIVAGGGQANVLVKGGRPFGSVGKLYFNPVGNGTLGRLQVQDGADIPNVVVLSGRADSGPAIQHLSGTSTFSGTLQLQVGGGNYVIQSDAGLLAFTGISAAATGGTAGTSILIGASSARTITLQGAGNGLVSGIIANGNATLNVTKTGTGTWTLSGSNSYGGATTISNGVLALGNAAGLGAFVSSSAAATGTTIANGASLELNGQSSGEGITSVLGTGYNAAGAILNSSATAATLTGPVTLTGATTFGGLGNLTANNVTGSFVLTKVGAGALTLAGTTDNTGLGLTVATGTVVLAKDAVGVRAVNGLATVNAGATLKLGGTGGDQIFNGASAGVAMAGGTFDLAGKSEVISNLSGSTGTLTNSSATASTLTFGTDSTGAGVTGTLGAKIQPGTGGLNLFKTGNGTQTLTGALTHGTTTVTGGKLVLGVNLNTPGKAVSVTGGELDLAASAVGFFPSVAAKVANISVGAGGLVFVPGVSRPSLKPRIVIADSISVAGGGTGGGGLVDLTNNDLMLKGQSEAAVSALVSSWWHNGARDGAGLGSSYSTNASNTTLAVVTNDSLLGGAAWTSFDNQSTVYGDVLVKYTYLGDVNIDGKVNVDDLNALVLGMSDTTLTGWRNGDINYDGLINTADLSLLMGAMGATGLDDAGAEAVSAAVPEPSSLGVVLGLGVLGLSRRRRVHG